MSESILLDTHAWLWMMIEPERLGKKTRALVERGSCTFRLSIASVWEIATKHAAGRLVLPEEPLQYVRARTRAQGVALLPIQIEHVCRAAALPKHHADPFDRLLIAQATMERLTLLSHDRHMAQYSISVRDPVR